MLQQIGDLFGLDCLEPVFGGQIECPFCWPVGQKDKQVADIGPWFDAVEFG